MADETKWASIELRNMIRRCQDELRKRGQLLSEDVPLCDGCAQAWFTERIFLPGPLHCVVCAFRPTDSGAKT